MDRIAEGWNMTGFREQPPDLQKRREPLAGGSSAQISTNAAASEEYHVNNAATQKGLCADTGLHDWRQGLPPDVIALVTEHRRHRPGDPLPAPVQKRIGRYWGAR